MSEAKFFLELVAGITFTIFAAILVLWCAERIARALWRDGDPREPFTAKIPAAVPELEFSIVPKDPAHPLNIPGRGSAQMMWEVDPFERPPVDGTEVIAVVIDRNGKEVDRVPMIVTREAYREELA